MYFTSVIWAHGMCFEKSTSFGNCTPKIFVQKYSSCQLQDARTRNGQVWVKYSYYVVFSCVCLTVVAKYTGVTSLN